MSSELIQQELFIATPRVEGSKTSQQFEADIIKDNVVIEPRLHTLSLDQMITKVSSEPRMKMIYHGIKENSVGFVFGPSKSGKTTYCENLAMSIASGANSYLERPIEIENRKVIFISLEEFYRGRTERNTKQASSLCRMRSREWLKNYIVADETIPRYLADANDWNIFYDIIELHKPGVVFLDSLSRLYEGNIEESKTGKEVMRRLRELADKTKTTVIVIHHTPKLYNSPLTINSIAGSRILAQDADFMIGINKTLEGKRYIKDVAYRYAPDDAEMVRTFSIGEDLWLRITGEAEEAKLLTVSDGRKDNTNRERLCEFLKEKSGCDETVLISSNEILEGLCDTGVMSKQTVYNQLLVLEKKGIISKAEKGKYKVLGLPNCFDLFD